MSVPAPAQGLPGIGTFYRQHIRLTRDKQTNKTSHFFVYTAGARPRITTILGTVIDEVRPIFEPPNFF